MEEMGREKTRLINIITYLKSMDNVKITAFVVLALAGGTLTMSGERVHVGTPTSSLLLDAPQGGELRILHYGTPLQAEEFDAPQLAGSPNHAAYPAYGSTRPEYDCAIACVQPDGNMTLYLKVDGAPEHRTEKDGAEVTTVTLKDPEYPVQVKVNYRTWPGEEVMETWTDITNMGKKPVTLTKYDSGYLPIRLGDVYMTTFYGSWSNEARVYEQPVGTGTHVIKNTDGVRNSHSEHSEILFSLDGPMREKAGRVIGAALEYSGNYKLTVDTEGESHYHNFFAGINEEHAPYKLEAGETLTTPPLALVYSSRGAGDVSRAFHRWGRKHRLSHGEELRPVLLNSWEGVYMDVNEPAMAGMMKDIASMGGELFVMDDGWFGDRYPRVNDTRGLGDWTVDTNKLPHGISWLVDRANENGIKFGIWIEPEMINTVSRLYDEHPEYVIRAKNREVETGRGGTQAVLDLSNPKVQDIVFNVVDTLLTKYPQIAYIKWDANASIMQHGSQYLPADKQGQLNVEFHRGLAKALDRIRAKYPDVLIQACASGGGRVNWGILPWFDEFWTSDNTDAFQRLNIQWGTSFFYPAVAMGSHISVVPNHNTHRVVPLKYRADVAMTGRLGMELQPKDMTDDDKKFCKDVIANYKKIRPVVQQGDLYRLLSPEEGKGAMSLMYVSPDKSEGAFFWFSMDGHFRGNHNRMRVAMDGLDPDKQYTVTELNRIDNHPLPFEGATFSGRYLMDNGLELPQRYDIDWARQTDLSSRVLHLQAK